jgi:hypothetical protein
MINFGRGFNLFTKKDSTLLLANTKIQLDKTLYHIGCEGYNLYQMHPRSPEGFYPPIYEG